MFYREFTFLYVPDSGRHLIMTADNRKLADFYQQRFINLDWPYILYFRRYDMSHFEIIDMSPPEGEHSL